MTTIYILLFTLFGVENSPDWLDHNHRKNNYPKDEFYQGFVSRSFASDENRLQVENEVVSQSRIRLSESIRVFISSKSTSTLSNVNSVADEKFQQKSVTRTELDASGLETLTYFDERKKVAYAFSFIKKRKLQSSYYKQLKDRMLSIRERINNYSEKKPPYAVLIELLDELDQVKAIQNTLSSTGMNNSIVLMTTQWNKRRDWVNELLSEMKEKESIDLEEAAVFIRDGLVADITSRSLADVKVNRMTYKNTGIATELSVLFSDYFDDVVSERFSVVSNDFDWVINSTYWPLKDKIKITTTIHQIDGGELVKLIASTSINVDRSIIDDLGVDYEPLKNEEDEEEYRVVTQREESDGEIIVEIATQKGNRSSVFMEGETLKLLTKVSRPSYIQLINVWADGSKLLLLDNYYADISQTNSYFELPFEWETACPCGIEYIYVIASSKPHSVPETTDQDGFLFIDEPLAEVLDKKRGFKRVSGDGVSEASLILTTVPLSQ